MRVSLARARLMMASTAAHALTFRQFDGDTRIEAVVAASGVELAQRGQGFMGCCPFHDDSTASLSVGGVADRFHCFGCGAGGDLSLIHISEPTRRTPTSYAV